MEPAALISVTKDYALQAALDHAAALNKPGTSEAELLRYLALTGYENLPEPYVEPTPEQVQQGIDGWMRLSRRFLAEQRRSKCGGLDR